jgi:hypothetical protein
MKLLDYKNKFKLILDVLFNPDRIQQKISSSIENIEQDFINKLRMIQYEQYKNGIVLSDKNRIPIMTMPIVDINRTADEGSPNAVSASISYKDVETTRLSFMNPTITGDELRNKAAFQLAQELVAKGFLHTKVDEHTITFYIQTFE